MEQNLPATILKALVHNEPFCRKALPHIKSEYFQNEYRPVYDLILEFIGKYNTLPNSTVLNVEYQNSALVTNPNAVDIARVIHELQAFTPVDEAWLIDTTEKWCKDRAVHIAIMEAFTIIDGRSKEFTEGMIPDILSKALSVTFDTNVGHDYLVDAQERYEYYHRVEDKLAFAIEIFNTITNGGLPKKTLSVFMAGCVHPKTKIKIRKRKPVPAINV